MDIEYLKSTVTLGLIRSVSSSEDLTHAVLRTYLDEEATETRSTVTLSGLEVIVRRELCMDMKNLDASSRMRTLFIDYHTLLSQHGLSWVIDSLGKIAVQHVFSVVRFAKLRSRLELNLSVSNAEIKKEFKRFFKHSRKIAHAFALVDCGSTYDGNANVSSANTGSNRVRCGRSHIGHGGMSAEKPHTKNKKEKNLPISLWPPHHTCEIRHRLKDRRDFPQSKIYFSESLPVKKSGDNPASNARAKTLGK